MTSEELYGIFQSCNRRISTDSRSILSGSIFFALRGESFDGNQYALDSLRKGASYAVVDDPSIPADDRLIRVDNVLIALQSLAAHHRLQLSIPILAIGGSNGKTTTKELVSAVLATQKNIHTTTGNLNNHIGVPLTILGINPEHQMAIVEIGANHPGEHTILMHILRPTHVLITNNGKDHLEGFGSLAGVQAANREIFACAVEEGATAFVSSYQADLVQDVLRMGIKHVIFGDTMKSLPGLTCSVSLNDDGHLVRTKLVGTFNAENVMAAVAIGDYFDITREHSIHAIEEYQPSLNRSQLLEQKNVIYVVDCYNANPTSMRLSLESFIQNAPAPRAVVLGDMFELGEFAPSEHQAIVNFLETQELPAIVLVGPMFGNTLGCQRAIRIPTTEELAKWMRQQNLKGFHILLKGSRGMRLETAIV